MIVIETNSCPSGQKSTPAMDSNLDDNGYQRLCEKTIKPRIQEAEAEGIVNGCNVTWFDVIWRKWRDLVHRDVMWWDTKR